MTNTLIKAIKEAQKQRYYDVLITKTETGYMLATLCFMYTGVFDVALIRRTFGIFECDICYNSKTGEAKGAITTEKSLKLLNDAKVNFGGGVLITKTPWQYDGFRVLKNTDNECIYVDSVFAELFAPGVPIEQFGGTRFSPLYNGIAVVSPLRMDNAPRKFIAE